MKKFKFTLLIILIAAILYGISYLKDNNYVFLYISPNNNTKSYPYIAKVSKKINSVLFQSAEALKLYVPEAKVLYTNGTGTGFLKNNVTASDFNYNAGVYIGNYEYTGQNSIQLAGKLLENITRHQTYFYSIIKNSGKDFYIPKADFSMKNILNYDKNLLSESIQKSMNGKPYELKVQSETFQLSPQEILLPNYTPVKLYSSDISYYQNYREILREIAVVISYYIDLTDTKTGKIYPMHFIAATPDGERIYQPEFKYFIPNTYTSLNSLGYLKNFTADLDDEEYIKTRFMNYFHHYNLDSYGNGKTFGNPLKTINNLIQCVEVLQPILPQNATQQMKKNAESILENTTLALLNDYYNANILIKDLAGKPEFYEELKSKNEISKLINDMEKILNDMINDPQMTYNDLKPLFEYQKILNDGKKDNEKIQNAIKTRYEIVNRYIENLMIRKMATKPSIINGYMNYLNKALETAGIYNVKFYKDKPNHIYVFRDKFTYKLSLDDLHKLDILNGNATKIYDEDTVFEFKNPNDFYEDTDKISYGWVMYKPTKQQKAVYDDVKKYMLKDKRNFHLRIRPGIEKNP